jgi:hypothetical protein
MGAWGRQVDGEITTYTARTGSSAVSLRDESGALTTLTVPDGGSVVVAPDCIIVSHTVR